MALGIGMASLSSYWVLQAIKSGMLKKLQSTSTAVSLSRPSCPIRWKSRSGVWMLIQSPSHMDPKPGFAIMMAVLTVAR